MESHSKRSFLGLPSAEAEADFHYLSTAISLGSKEMSIHKHSSLFFSTSKINLEGDNSI